MDLRRYIRIAQALSFLVISTAYPAYSAELVEEYVAYIGEADLYNSRGSRLTEFWQIIRQDRANYHKFGIRQPGDTGDIFFSSKQNRAIAEQMIMRGNVEPSASRSIVNGHVLIHVKIYGHASQGEYLNITVL